MEHLRPRRREGDQPQRQVAADGDVLAGENSTTDRFVGDVTLKTTNAFPLT